MDSLTLTRQGDVLEIELNRPEKLNALNREMVDQLRTVFQDLYRDQSARVVVLKGAGRSFCAGLDLQQASSSAPGGSVSDRLDRQRALAEVYVAMRRCPQPVICQVQGAASGGGFALALASDIRILSEDARMNAAFIRIGLSACDMGVSYFLPRMVGQSLASEYLLTGRFIDAPRAAQIGLANRVVPQDQMAHECDAFVEDMLRATPLGLRLTKDGLNLAIDAGGLEAVMAIEDRNQMLTAGDPNFQEGMRAFLEKRRPNYD
ncbi:MAG: enoyl-CoA hydratase [Alphaproteobacteria bacterium HGW-Alphaproteobacteria-18]|nr:MAG: enoyl-CoA hydratase [Alphaproteobacteria bacterium HGW-Alphaproteobacteria-18]